MAILEYVDSWKSTSFGSLGVYRWVQAETKKLLNTRRHFVQLGLLIRAPPKMVERSKAGYAMRARVHVYYIILARHKMCRVFLAQLLDCL